MLSSCGHSHNSADSSSTGASLSEQDKLATTTPIKHLVVIFGENESFDHYFGTYPQAKNPSGEPTFTAASGTPQVNGYEKNATLLTANPNTTNADNLAAAGKAGFSASYMNPYRIDRTQFDTASQNHAYTPEQLATHGGKMDAFVTNTGKGIAGGSGSFGTIAQVMGYFDGNTVTGMWNYAQHFAMNDHAYTDSFGPSTPGALNVISGTTSGADKFVAGDTIPDGQGAYTMVNDADPSGDTCSSATANTTMAGKNIGDLLNAANITWGGFMGGFDLTATNSNGTTSCKRSTVSPNTSRTVVDYIPHHAWFQYYASTENKNHTRPSSTAMIGHTETTDTPGGATAVNHQYDYNDFVTAVSAGNFASVSYIKAPAFQDAHPGNSNALDEQAFVTKVINFLQQQPDWKNTAVIVTYDDSDGWYDHLAPTIIRSSFDATTSASINVPNGTFASGSGTITGADQENGAGSCTATGATQPLNVNGKAVNGRCGPGSRIPFILISPYAKVNYVDSTPITQSSVIRFIEDNWLGGKRLGGGSNDATAGSIMAMFDFTQAAHTTPLFLDPTQGTVTATAPAA
ncbi:phospholipase C [Sphingomonas abietis]|uniref:Alkaline phosphatase family protein n=1 Tax=Sphingomonas abietis TaxID=3012344 RepID=A0ABY7NS41_9SPHN|nr:alkaline phosphatase family protein [Sphingomonas abietis]WBO23780.1 alkaline phosphatase family protein [Sphingomonas abietis]